MPVAIRAYKRLSTRAFTLMEVMVAGLILAVGIMTAMGTVLQSNNLRRFIDENHFADLTLRQVAERLKSTPLGDLGHTYSDPTSPRWTMHLRATNSASSTTPLIIPPDVSMRTPLTMQELISAGILLDPVPLAGLECYIEYYNVRAETGAIDSATLKPIYNGLLDYFYVAQNSNRTPTSQKSIRSLWYDIVGNPELKIASSDLTANQFTMPQTFTIPDQSASGANLLKINGAKDHGLAIRILIAWQPFEAKQSDPNSPYKRWRETVIIKRS